ncbi:ABC transporter substrate-binding protein [Falsiroseomonas ponticola]|uniref:ABC transporter substrate-binding protein n=1 Tax=Falsiroseomonas ponticola TaxID=2786951 RepID=UPI0019327F34|nr:ABC transporter substrate-binding protein [Roseomonas ponticola]
MRLPRLLLLLLAAAPLLTREARAQEITFGTAGSLGDASAAVALGIERGWFADAGIQARIVDFRGGAPAVQALVGNGITYCICAPEHAVRLRNRNVDGAIAFALDRRHTYSLLVRANSPARSLADLRGQRVGITSAGSLTENLARLAFARDGGLQVGRDVELLGAGVGAAQKAALDTNRIAAGMFGNLDSLRLEGQGYRILYDWRTQNVPSLALIARQRWLEENEGLARRATRVILRAQALLLDDREVATATLRRLYPELPAEVTAQVAAGLPDRLSRDGIYTRDEITRLQDDLIATDPSIRPQPYEVVMPTRLLQAAR